MTTTDRSRRARRRIAVLVAALAVAAVGVAAVVVGLRASGGSADAGPAPSGEPTGAPGDPALDASPSPEQAEELLGVDRLLLATEVAQVLPGRTWRVVGTDDNTRGRGLRWVCQQARYADPEGLAALVRTTTAQGVPVARLVQTVERSRSPAAARAAYATTVDWLAACRAARLQLVGSFRVEGMGDRATLLTFRTAGRRPGHPASALEVVVVRVGDLTSTLVLRRDDARTAPLRQATRLLTRAARRLCPQEAPRCVRTARLRPVPPPPSGEAPGTLGVVDLPPVGRITEPWFGIDPVAARRTNPARTTCDRADFSGPEVRRAFSRTYLVPDAPLPARFGLTETVAVFGTTQAARGFLDQARVTVAGCGDRALATTVTPGPDVAREPAERASWTLDTEIAEDRSVRLRVGFVRSGRMVAQLTFAPSDADDLTGARFDALLARAGERLGELGSLTGARPDGPRDPAERR